MSVVPSSPFSIENEGLLWHVADALPVLMSYIDVHQHYRYVNKAYEEWLGLAREEIIGRTVEDMIGPDSYEIHRPYIERALSGEKITFENNLSHWQLGRRDCRLTYLPDLEPNGAVRGYVVLVMDVTEETAARRVQHFLQHASEALSESLDLPTTLKTLANLAVPDIADWCLIDMFGEAGECERVETVSAHPVPPEVLASVRRFPLRPQVKCAFSDRLRKGEAIYWPDLPPNFEEFYTQGEEHARLLKQLGVRSFLALPLLAQGRLEGAMILTTAESGRKFSEGDLRLARELARRASLALENALLYRQAEAQRQRLYSLFMQAPAAICVLRGPEMRFELANEPYQRLVGEHRQLIGKTVEEVLPSLEPGLCEVLSRVLSTGQRFVGSEFPIHMDWYGSGEAITRYFNVVYEPTRDLNGKIDGLITLAYEVSEQVKARQRIAESEERYSSLVKALSSVVWIANPEGAFITPQRSWEFYTGQAWDKHQGFGWVEMIHPEDRGLMENAWAQAVREKDNLCEVKGRLWHASSRRYRHVEVRAVPLRNKDGSVREWVGTVTDVEDAFRFVRALREGEERFKSVAESIPQIVWTATAEGHHDYFNSRFQAFTGIQWEGRREEVWESVIHPDDWPESKARWAESVAGGRIFEREHRLLHAVDGTYQWHLARCLPLRNDRGKIVKWFGTSTNIHEQKQASEDLRLSQDRLQKAVKVRDEFLSIASHELRTPLTSLKLQTQMRLRELDRSAEGAFTKQRLAKIWHDDDRQIERLARLIDDMLDISRIETGKLAFHFEVFDLSDAVTEVIERFRGQFEAAGSELRVHLAPVWVRQDRYRTEQVVSNLLSNALKYGAGRAVDVSVRRENGRALLSIRDQGIGIALEDQDRIFERFERAAPDRGVTGLGLGLYIVRRILKAQGGSIRLRSELGQGSEFLIEIPLSESAREKEPPVLNA